MAGNERRNNAFHTQIKNSVVSDFCFFSDFFKKNALELGDPPSDLAKSGPGEASGTPETLRTAFWARFGILFQVAFFSQMIIGHSCDVSATPLCSETSLGPP
jgi:hypothetical protein